MRLIGLTARQLFSVPCPKFGVADGKRGVRRSCLMCATRANSALHSRSAGPADIAALAVHLMTNTTVTGATYDIDGGQQLVKG
jgi:hypothetical protein